MDVIGLLWGLIYLIIILAVLAGALWAVQYFLGVVVPQWVKVAIAIVILILIIIWALGGMHLPLRSS